MTSDEILAALENARMDLERACETLSDAGLHGAASQVYGAIVYLRFRHIDKLLSKGGKTNER